MLGLLPVLVREALGPRRLARRPEPEAMVDEAHVSAFAEGGRRDGPMAAAYVFHAAHATQVIRGSARVVDLGCGSGTQLALIARLNPESRFIGLDLSDAMLREAAAHVTRLALTNVSLWRGDATRLDAIDDASVDAVVSTVALHHLPTRQDLRRCFASIRRVLRPGGAVYIADFGRPKAESTVRYLVTRDRREQSELFVADFEASLRAAFEPRDFEALAAEFLPGAARVHATAMARVLLMLRTRPRPLSDGQRRAVAAWRDALGTRARGQIEELRRLFRLGGLGADPFAV